MADPCIKLFGKDVLQTLGPNKYNQFHQLFKEVQAEFLKTNPDTLDSFASASAKTLFEGNKNLRFKTFLWKKFGRESNMTYKNFEKEFFSKENIEYKTLEELTGDLIIKKASIDSTIQFKQNYVTTVKAQSMSNKIVKQMNKWKKQGVKKWFQAFGNKKMADEDIFALVLRSMIYKSKWGDNTPVESIVETVHSRLYYQPRVKIEENWGQGKYPELEKKFSGKPAKATMKALNSNEIAEQVYELMNLVATGKVKVLRNGKISKDLKELTFNKDTNPAKVKIEQIAKDYVELMWAQFKQIKNQNFYFSGTMTNSQFVGKPMLIRDLVVGKEGDMTKAKQRFIDDMVEAVDDETVMQYYGTRSNEFTEGDILREKKNLMDQLWNDYFNYKDEYAFGYKGEETRNRRFIIFKDGRAKLNIIKKYAGATENKRGLGGLSATPLALIHNQMRTIANEQALTQVFGNNVTGFLEKFAKEFSKTDYGVLTKNKYFDWFEQVIINKTQPSRENSTKVGKFLTGFRNLNLMKLGNIVYDQTLLEPWQAAMLMNAKNWKGFKAKPMDFHPLFHSVNQFHKLSKNARGKSKDEMRKLAKMMAISIEQEVGTLNVRHMESLDRLGSPDGLFATSEKWGNLFMNIGITQLSDRQADRSLGVLRYYLTEVLDEAISVKSPTFKWLETTNPNFHKELTRHGINAKDWDDTVKAFRQGRITDDGIDGIVDSTDKLVNIVGFQNSTTKIALKESATLYDKWHKFFQTNIDEAGRPRPDGEIKNLMLLMDKDAETKDMMMGVYKSIMQFKSFQMIIGTKQFGRVYQETQSLAALARFAAHMAVSTFFPAMMVIQLRRISAGKQPFSMDDSTLYEQMLTRMPILGTFAIIPPFEWATQQLIRAGGNLLEEEDEQKKLGTGFDMDRDMERHIFGMTLGAVKDFARTLGDTPSVWQREGLMLGTAEQLYKLGMQGLRSAMPSAPFFNIFKNEVFDTMQYLFDYDSYKRRQKREWKRGESEHDGLFIGKDGLLIDADTTKTWIGEGDQTLDKWYVPLPELLDWDPILK